MVAMRRVCAVLLLAASAALPQKISVGLKGGVPLTDALQVTDKSRYVSDKAPSVIGPAVEVYLPLGLSAEVDLLYRRLQYRELPGNALTTGQLWELPLLGKGRLPALLVFTPVVSAGFSFRRLANFKPGIQQAPALTGRNAAGPTIGGGLEVKAGFMRVSAELRYTRWGSSSFKAALGGLSSQLNQADFMLGIMF
jgi:hypothetical protein